jgi:argininosuccinate synthase
MMVCRHIRFGEGEALQRQPRDRAGRTSPYSLYDTKLATYTEEDSFDHKASIGFIKIYGLPTKNVLSG